LRDDEKIKIRMKRILTPSLFIFLFILLYIGTACHETVQEIDQEEEDLIKFWEQFPGSRLESALSIAEFYEEMDEVQKATFGHVLFVELNKLNFRRIKDPRLLKDVYEYIDYSIDYYLQTKDYMRAIECYSYKGEFLLTERRYTEATKTLLKAIDIQEKENYPGLTAKIYFYLGRVSGYQEEFQEALTYIDLAIAYAGKDSLQSEIAKMYIVKGWIYDSLKDVYAALPNYRRALELTTDPVVIGDLFNSIGSSYTQIKQLDSALYYCSRSLEYPYIETNYSIRLYHLAEVYHKLHKTDSALLYANQAFDYPVDVYFQRNLYDLLREIAVEQEDNKNIAFYTKQYQAASDSIRKISSQPGPHIMQQIHELDKITIQVKSHRYYLSIFLIVISVIASMIIFYLYYKQRSKKTGSRYL
ncbi:MAG: tetratricopeptide repeat protein, partial [Tannerellaceae bacterium]|nr:tetratricopeptide repeat protein [Tannerellaceae bacterium]